MKITLIGMGVESGDLSIKAQKAIASGAKVMVKTPLVESYGYFIESGISHTLSDEIYKKSRDFDTLNKNLAKAVLREAKEQAVVYCVDGAALDDNSCKIIIEKHKDVEIICGVSKSEKLLERLKKGGGCKSDSAYVNEYKVASDESIIIYDIDNKYIASEVKLKLAKIYGDNALCVFSYGGKLKNIKLYELDRQVGYGYDAALYVEKIDLLKKETFNYDDLIAIVRILRSENGCPWDKAQTHDTIRKNLIEECYELVDALDRKDVENMIEELGDVLLQVALHTIIGEQSAEFEAEEVSNGICKKLIARHTHIFGADKAKDESEALKVWEKNKLNEKHSDASAYITAVPKTLPSLMRAQKIGSRAAKFKFDFSTPEAAAEKIKEELKEVIAEVKSGSKQALTMEIGDLLFAVVNYSRLLGIDAEEALSLSSEKFIGRFCGMDDKIKKDGKTIGQLNADELNGYYDAVKTDKTR